MPTLPETNEAVRKTMERGPLPLLTLQFASCPINSREDDNLE